MRVRIIKDIRLAGLPGITWFAGSVAEVSAETADKWFKSGMAMQDKSLDGAKETKAVPPRQNDPLLADPPEKQVTIAPPPLRNQVKKHKAR